MHALWRIAFTNLNKELLIVLRNISPSMGIAALSAIITISYVHPPCAQTVSGPDMSPVTAVRAESPAIHSDDNPVTSTDLLLEVHLSTKEQSKDSHGRSSSVIIKDGLVTYSVRYFGMDPRSNKERHFSLSKEHRDRLIAYIIHNGLNRNLREIKSDATLGTSIKVSTKIQIGHAVTEAKVSGAYSDWTKTSQKKPPSNLENLDYYHAISGLLMFMRSALGFAAIEP